MKSMRRKDAIRELKNAGFEWRSNGPHIKYIWPIDPSIWIALAHDREVSPGVVRDIFKAISKTKNSKVIA